MRTIKRYELKEGTEKITCPVSAVVVSAGTVEEKIVVWMEVETEEREFGERAFLVVEDGKEIEEGMVGEIIGVAVMPSGKAYIVFELL